MKKLFFPFVLLLFLCSSGNVAKADHYLGMDLTYKCSGTNDSVFNITLLFYRDCRGCYLLSQSPKCGTSENCSSSSTVPTKLTLTCASSSTSVGTITMSRTGIVDITGTCKKEISKCTQPCNGNYPYGIEKHVFEGTLDLRAEMKKGCCKFRLGTSSLCCRSASISTGPSGDFYTYLDIDACLKSCNSSPQFTNDPLVIMCCNKPYFYNCGALDKENDSLSYSLESAYSAAGTKSSYTSPYSSTYPLKGYFPTGKTPPFSDPAANPPVGFFLDKNTGDLILTPSECGQEGVVVILLDEWKKDSKGTYQKTSSVRREINFMVQSCPNDNPPKITNKTFNYSVCEGNKLCFDITTEDKVYIPPPPASTPAPDTISLTWNNGISDATFSIKDPTAREKTATFCWTPKKGTASDIPYTFTANATSNSCPLTASYIRSFTIKVNGQANSDRSISKLGCNTYKVKSTPKSGIKSSVSYDWSVLDSTGNKVSDGIAFFKSGINKSNKDIDTLKITNAGKYYLKHTINDTRNCPTIYFDTLIVEFDRLSVKSILGKDTTVCPGTFLDLKAEVKIGVPKFKYQWITSAKNTKDTLSTFRLITSERDTILQVEIRDANGCIGYDTLKFLSFSQPKVDLGKDLELCQGDSALLNAGAFYFYKWNTGKTSQTITVKTQGNYKVNVTDVNGCKASDSLDVKMLQLPKVRLGNDTSICQGDSLKLDAGLFAVYKWNTGKTTRSIFPKAQGKYSAFVTDSKGCKGSDSILISVSALPKPNLGNDTAICNGDSIKLNAGSFSKYNWNTGKTTQSVFAKTQGKFKVTVEDNKGCKGSDSAMVTVNALPSINLGKDTTLCNGDSLKLDAGSFSVYKWSNSKTTRAITVKTQANYSLEVTNSNGCKNSDAIFVAFKNCSGNVGIMSLKNVKVFPNPAIDILTIEFNNSGEIADVSIQDLSGKILFKKTVFVKGFVSEQINIKGFDRGYHIVDIKTEEGSFSGKVLLN
jgi:hypothetical protein